MSFQPSYTGDGQHEAQRVTYPSRGQSYSHTAAGGYSAQQAQEMQRQEGFFPHGTPTAAAPYPIQQSQASEEQLQKLQELQQHRMREVAQQQEMLRQQQQEAFRQQQQQQSQLEQAHYNGGPNAAPFLRNFNLVAEAARRPQVAVLTRDMEGVGI